MDVETLRRQARELADSGKLAEVHRVYSVLHDELRRRLGDAHPQTLQLVNDRASVELRQGRFPAAQQSAQDAAEARAGALGAEHPDTLRSRFLIGAVLHDAGRTGEARTVFEQLVPVFEKVFGRSGPETRELIGELARLVRAAGEEDLARRLEARDRPRFDHTVPDTWTLTTALGVQEAQNGKLAEAAEILRGVVEQGPRGDR
jgi:hypothetical protein